MQVTKLILELLALPEGTEVFLTIPVNTKEVPETKEDYITCDLDLPETYRHYNLGFKEKNIFEIQPGKLI